MSDYITLKGAVFSKFHNISDFAVALGWKRNKTARIVNGIQEPNSSEIEKMAIVLGINSEKAFLDIFFPLLSTKWTPIINDVAKRGAP